jgi:uncharacterized protein YndB with AHSA1/START domain
VIAAPPERVWAALVDPGALLAWLPPGEMTGTFERFDVRPARQMLSDAGFTSIEAAHVDGDIAKTYFIATKN